MAATNASRSYPRSPRPFKAHPSSWCSRPPARPPPTAHQQRARLAVYGTMVCPKYSERFRPQFLARLTSWILIGDTTMFAGAGALEGVRPYLSLAGLALHLLVEAQQELAAVIGREAEHAELVGQIALRQDEVDVHLVG